ncbi:MAG: tubulin/FtsZ family protein [Canidatus Methanoxibalbensis ujae]|nr:tubulin/FtsZ family protein [Candidatus Methanoxibalbensis ujae]MCW7078008.1 tubulin/FtsZ family protein [Candidatus Methanoxibalbensis ujae]
MKVFVIGFGQAGGKVADLFLKFDREMRMNCVVRVLAINTAKPDLMGLEHIPIEDRLLIGEAITKGHGIGADNELGAKITSEEIHTIQSAIDRKGTHLIDAFLIIAGLGGGTGSGGAPVLARRLKMLYDEPVYGLGILPARDEGGLYALNAARSLKTFVKEVDNLLLFDNDAWKRSGESVVEAHKYMNIEIVRRLSILFGAGESDVVGEMVVDAAEVINTLRGGGISVIGYAAEEIEENSGTSSGGGIFKKVFGGKKKTSIDTMDGVTRIMSLTKRAIVGRLTIPCDVTTAERALIIVAGPPEYISRKGVESARKRVEELIRGTEVRGGDFPIPKSKHVAALTLFSNVSDIPRVRELQEMAVEAQEKLREITEEKEREYKELLESREEIKPLF